ncbi:MAG: SiaB family protein kinase [Bacteroidales bacterium]|nr:SiaB family protein kinase [Bacteroidales bacterium]
MEIAKRINTVVTSEKGLLLSYSGYFFIDFLTIFGRKIRILTKKDYFASFKMFKIFMELAQNISLYSEQRVKINDDYTVGFGTFTLTDSGSFYHLSGCNFVKNEDAKVLTDRCNKINSLSKPELRAMKREQRRLSNGYKIGARVGLIQIAILAGSKLDVSIQPHENGLSLFTISTTVEKF